MTQKAAINVLHVFGTMDRGGAELRTLELVSALDPALVSSHFLTLSGRPGALDAEIVRLGGQVHVCPLTPAFRREFRRVVSTHNIDVVHSHVHDFSGLILREAARAGVPTRIAHYRSTGDGHRASARRRLQRVVMRRWIGRYATQVLAVSEAAMVAAAGPHWREDDRCSVVYNGLDVGPYQGLPDRHGVRRALGLGDEALLVAHVGNHRAAKNHERVLSVFAAVHVHEPRARLLLIGAGQQLGAMAGGPVAALGERRDVPRLLQAADVLLMPSLREGLPGALLEACAAGLPAVASDVPGAVEVAASFDTVTCLSLEENDQVWAQHVLVALRSSNRPTADVAVRKFSESRFALQPMARRMTDLWTTGG